MAEAFFDILWSITPAKPFSLLETSTVSVRRDAELLWSWNFGILHRVRNRIYAAYKTSSKRKSAPWQNEILLQYSYMRHVGYQIYCASMLSRTEVINGTPKGTSCTSNTYFEPSLTFARLSVRAMREPKNAEKRHKKNVIFQVCIGGAPVQPTVLIFCTFRDLADVIKHAKFYIDRFRGFWPS